LNFVLTTQPIAKQTAWITLAIGLLLIGQQILIVPGNSLLASTIHNAMHVPWSAAITFLLWRLTGRWHYAVLIALAIGLGSEGTQILTGRTASLTDVLSDALGISLATAVYAMYRSRLRRTKLLACTAVVIVTAYTLWPIVMVHLSRNWLMQHVPVMFDASDLRGYYLAEITADYERVGGSSPGLRISLTEKPWSGVHLRELPRPETMLQHLVLDLTVEGDAPLRLGTSMLYWETPEPGWMDHRLDPGHQELVIPVEKLDGRYPFRYGLDLYIYGYGEQAGRSFILHRVHLR
jgi:hypothetical protein